MAGICNRLKGNIFEFATAAGWCFAGIAYVVYQKAPVHSLVGRSVHPLDYCWSSFYVVGGPLVMFALLFGGHPHLRIAGLVLLSAGLLMQGVAALRYAPFDPRVGTVLVYAIACGLRALLCWLQTTKRTT